MYLNNSYIFIHISFISYYLTPSAYCEVQWCVWGVVIMFTALGTCTVVLESKNPFCEEADVLDHHHCQNGKPWAPSSSWGRVWRCNISWMWQVLNEFKSAVLDCSKHHFGLTVRATVTGGRAFLVRWALPMSIALIFSCSCFKRLCSMSLYHDSWPGSPSAAWSLVHKNEGHCFAYRSHHFCSFWQQILGVSIVSIPPSSLAESVDPSLIHAYKLLKKSHRISPVKNGKTVPRSFSTPWWYGVHCG